MVKIKYYYNYISKKDIFDLEEIPFLNEKWSDLFSKLLPN